MHDARPSRSHLQILTAAVLTFALFLTAACQPIQPLPETEGAAEAAPTEEPAEEAPAGEEAAAEAMPPEMAAPPMSEAFAAYEQVTIDVSPDGIVVPAEITAGPVVLNRTNSAGTTNEDGSPVTAEVGRLVEGVTIEQLMEVLATAEENPGPALELVKLYGGSFMGQATMANLMPGSYVALTTGGEPAVAEFTVVEGEAMDEPEAAVEATLMDFTFVIPDEIAAGPQLWKISNKGEQWHEIVIIQLQEGMTVEDVLATFAGPEMEGPPPFDFFGGYGVISEGNEGWIEFDLAPGEYTVICFLPNLAGDFSPHAMHGMVRTLIVK